MIIVSFVSRHSAVACSPIVSSHRVSLPYQVGFSPVGACTIKCKHTCNPRPAIGGAGRMNTSFATSLGNPHWDFAQRS